MRHYWQCRGYRDFLRFEKTCLPALLGYVHECSPVIDPHHYPPVSSGISDDSDCLPFCRTAHRCFDTDRDAMVALLERSYPHKLKLGYFKEFITFLGLQSQKPVQKVKNRKKAEAVKTSHFQDKLQPGSKKRSTSPLRPLDKPNYMAQALFELTVPQIDQ